MADDDIPDDRPAARETPEVASAGALARFFFLKTTFGILLVTLLTLGGVMSYFSLVKESLPDLDIPQATITTTWPGADPQTIEKQVTDKIETELTSLQGLKAINSASFDSVSVISVEFIASTDERRGDDATARQGGRRRGEPARRGREADHRSRSRSTTARCSASPCSATPTATVLSDLAHELQDRLEAVPGVNEVDLGGAARGGRADPPAAGAAAGARPVADSGARRNPARQHRAAVRRDREREDRRGGPAGGPLPRRRRPARAAGHALQRTCPRAPVRLDEVAIVERGLEKPSRRWPTTAPKAHRTGRRSTSRSRRRRAPTRSS